MNNLHKKTVEITLDIAYFSVIRKKLLFPYGNRLLIHIKVGNMSYESDDDIIDDEDNSDFDDSVITEKKSEASNAEVRKRIDDLLERKRLKELLDDTDDW